MFNFYQIIIMTQGFSTPSIAPCVKSLFKAIELLNARMNMSTASASFDQLKLLIDAVLTGFACLVNMSKVLPGNIYETIAGTWGRRCVGACMAADAQVTCAVGLRSLEHFIDTLQSIRFLYAESIVA